MVAASAITETICQTFPDLTICIRSRCIAMRINPLKKEEPKKTYACAQSSKTMNINQFTEHIATYGASTAVRTLRLSGAESAAEFKADTHIAACSIKQQMVPKNVPARGLAPYTAGSSGFYYLSSASYSEFLLLNSGTISFISFTVRTLSTQTAKCTKGSISSLISLKSYSRTWAR